jgi:hypothetical protein
MAATLLSQIAHAQSLPPITIDDFTTGPTALTIDGAQQTANIVDQRARTGAHAHLIGGVRLSSLDLTLVDNVYRQNAQMTIAPARGGALASAVFGQGFATDAVFGMNYGTAAGPTGKSLHANFSGYDRFRVHFIGVSGGIDMTILAYTGTGYTEWGCNIPGVLVPTVVDYPFANGSGSGANLAALDGLVFQSENASAQASTLGISRIEVVPAGTPAADITCPPGSG